MQIVPELMRECFNMCSIYGCSCIAFPPLGVGRLYNYQPYDVAMCMIDEIRRQTQTNGIQVGLNLNRYVRNTFCKVFPFPCEAGGEYLK